METKELPFGGFYRNKLISDFKSLNIPKKQIKKEDDNLTLLYKEMGKSLMAGNMVEFEEIKAKIREIKNV